MGAVSKMAGEGRLGGTGNGQAPKPRAKMVICVIQIGEEGRDTPKGMCFRTCTIGQREQVT